MGFLKGGAHKRYLRQCSVASEEQKRGCTLRWGSLHNFWNPILPCDCRVMMSVTVLMDGQDSKDPKQSTADMTVFVEPIRNFFAALFLASIGMLIHVHFSWNHIDILLAAVILVIVIKTLAVATVVKGFRYNNKTSLLVGMSLAQIGEFAFVLLSRASNVHLDEQD
ncbi:hypothetical protein ACSBR1_016756 [Camellia fascicularis]